LSADSGKVWTSSTVPGRPPLDKEEDSFRVQAENGRVRFEFKVDHTSEEASRFTVNPGLLE